jgi:hypothetical protein
MGVKATKDMEQQLPYHISKQMGVKQPHMGKTVVLTTKHAKDRLKKPQMGVDHQGISKELGLTVSIRPSVNDIGHFGDSRSLSIKQSEIIDGSPQNHLPHRIHVCYIW